MASMASTPAQTNSIIAPLPAGMASSAARMAFNHFGEVASIKVVPKNEEFVQVVFYDVRSASTALKAFGPAGCLPGPQVGDRTVELAGDEELSMKDFSKISEVLKSGEHGAFTLEFFDYRDAMRYRKQNSEAETSGVDISPGDSPDLEDESPMEKPPGLTPPPGLEPKTSKCGTVAAAVSADWQVIIKGLPAKLLSEAMLEAVLQQAGLDGHHVGFNMKGGKNTGEVIVKFSSMFSAQRCVLHFEGCQWDKSGTAVTTEILPPSDDTTKMAAEEKSSRMQKQKKKTATAVATEFQPSTAFSGFSAEAPVFVPSSSANLQVQADSSTAASQKVSRSGSKNGMSSDTSTEVGESEDDEKSNSPVESAWVKGSVARPRSSSSVSN